LGAKLIVLAAFFRVREHLIGFVDLLEHLLSLRVIRVFIRMVLQS